MNITKRTHYLPQFYLNNFINKDINGFYVYYKGDENIKIQTPINTGIEKNLYPRFND
jgi:hypothetical protein